MASIKKVKAELRFEIIILICTLGYIISAFSLSSLAGRFPLAVAFFALIILILRILQLMKTLRQGGDTKEEARPSLNPWLKALPGIIWLAGLVCGFYVFGIVIGSIVFTFCFVKFFGKESTKASLISTLIVLLIVYLLFGVAMKFPLHGGFLEIKLPGTLLK